MQCQQETFVPFNTTIFLKTGLLWNNSIFLNEETKPTVATSIGLSFVASDACKPWLFP